MKKRISAIMTMALLVSLLSATVIAFTGCSRISPNIFKGYMVDLKGIASLGIAKQKAVTAVKGVSVNIDTTASSKSDNRNRFVAISEEEIMSEIVFKRILPTGAEDDTVKQAEIVAQIDKLYVTAEYVFFTLTTKTINRTNNETYDKTHYKSDKKTQSFLIDRDTGHIYSLAQMPNIATIEGSVVSTVGSNGKKTFYRLTIESDQIKFTDLVPNKNIEAKNAFVDNNGMIFIENDTISQITESAVYYVQQQSAFGYSLGSDGNFYKVRLSNNGPFYHELWVFDKTAKDWAKPDVSNVFSIKGTIWPNDGLLFKNGVIYASVCMDYYIYRYEEKENSLGIYYLLSSEETSLVHGRLDDHRDACIIVNESIYCLTLGKITAYVTATYEQSRIGIPLVDGITSIDEVSNAQILVTREEFDGTKKYRLFTDANNLPQCQLLSDQTYDANIIIIRPLF